jgi:NTE family protein
MNSLNDLIPLYRGKRKNILVISGGGLKGLSALGALKCLIDNDIIFFPEIFAGSSVGSGICFLINIGYSPKDIYDLLEKLNFLELIKYVDVDNLFKDPCFGIASPEPMLEVIYNFMKKKNIPKTITFKQLYDLTQSKLIITGTCINTLTTEYFSIDTYPDMQVLKAIRISISIPFIFRPYSFDNKIWVDGGCMNNFPIELFKDKLDDVIGIYIDDEDVVMNKIPTIEDYFIRIFKCLMKGLNANKIEFFKKYIVHINTNGNHTINWEITQDEKKNLYEQGYLEAQKFIQTQNYD